MNTGGRIDRRKGTTTLKIGADETDVDRVLDLIRANAVRALRCRTTHPRRLRPPPRLL
jgi:uncharacterized protein YaaQ